MDKYVSSNAVARAVSIKVLSKECSKSVCVGGHEFASMACVMRLGMRPKASALPPTTAILRPDLSIRFAVGVRVILTVRQRTLDCRDMGGIFFCNNVLMTKQVSFKMNKTKGVAHPLRCLAC